MSTTSSYLPTTPRVLSIIQLCLALGLFLWVFSYPFMGAHYFYKSQALLYEEVLGKDAILTSLGRIADPLKLDRNRANFEQLANEIKSSLLERYNVIQAYLSESFSLKVKHAFELLFFKLPRFQLVWILLAIAIPILLLLKIEGSRQAVWILPLVTMLYICDNHFYGLDTKNSDETFFPSESLILSQYLKEPLKAHWPEQRDQLKKGWQLYLIGKWAQETPSSDEGVFLNQADNGEFAFNIARLQASKPLSYIQQFREKRHPLTLGLIFLWNLLFALAIYKTTKNVPLMPLTK